MKYTETKYRGLFIGSDGRFYSNYRSGKMTLKKAKLTKGNIKVVSYKKEGKKKYINVRREVALLLVPNPENKRLVITKDGNYMNSHPDNLEWSNVGRMDYEAFAERKKGMVYKSYVNMVIGSYTVIDDDTKSCTLSCNSCKDEIIVNRDKVKNKRGICKGCRDYSLDLSLLTSAAFHNWDVIREDGTEQLSSKSKKRLIVRCKCCGQQESISYKSYRDRKEKFKCNITKDILKSLSTKFSNMKSRCYNKKDKSYTRYGGRGIKICNQWLDNPKSFYDWAINNNFSLELEIDRRDNNKGYSPDNCRFTSKADNNRNQSKTLLSKELVVKIRTTDWEDKNNRDIAQELGLDRVSGGQAVSHVRRGKSWLDI